MKLDYNDRLSQLRDSLELLKEAIENVEKGNSRSFISIATLLRALIAKGKKDNFIPLLLSLASIQKNNMVCFGPQPATGIYLEATLFIRNSYISISQVTPRQARYNLEDWLDSPIFVYKKRAYTPNTLLRTTADKEGSHFDEKIPDDYAEIKNMMWTYSDGKRFNEIQRFLYETAITIQELGTKVLAGSKFIY